MNEGVIGAIISGVVAISAAILGKTDIFNRDHIKILKDTQLYDALPDKSTSKSKLLARIDEKVEVLIRNEKKLTRDATGITLGLLFVCTGAYLTWFFISRGSWWRIGLTVSAFMVILGLAGFTQDVSRRERDHKGRPVKKKS